MKAPEKVVFAFDPSKSEIPLLQDHRGLIIWACIKYQHITDQHLNTNITNFLETLDKMEPTSYEEFKKIVIYSKLASFGERVAKETMFICNRELDDTFWKPVWDYINGDKELEMVIEC